MSIFFDPSTTKIDLIAKTTIQNSQRDREISLTLGGIKVQNGRKHRDITATVKFEWRSVDGTVTQVDIASTADALHGTVHADAKGNFYFLLCGIAYESINGTKFLTNLAVGGMAPPESGAEHDIMILQTFAVEATTRIEDEVPYEITVP